VRIYSGVILAGVLLAGCAGHKEKLAVMVRIAQKARLSGNSEASIKFYEQALALDPNNTEALLGIAEAYIDMNLRDAASEYIKKAMKLGCDAAKAAYLRGKIHLLSGDYAEAEKEFQRSATVDAKNALGAIYDGRGEHLRAQKLYQQVIAMSPSYIDAYNNMGLSLMLSGKHKEAVHYLQNACSLPSANPAFRSNLAIACALSGDIKQAKSIYAQDYDGAELQAKEAYLEDIVSSQ
jgi:Flp pilus assembly protein TadD